VKFSASSAPPRIHISPHFSHFPYLPLSSPLSLAPSLSLSLSLSLASPHIYLYGIRYRGIVRVHMFRAFPFHPVSRVRRRHFFRREAHGLPPSRSHLPGGRGLQTALVPRLPLFAPDIRTAGIKRRHISDLLPARPPARPHFIAPSFISFRFYGVPSVLIPPAVLASPFDLANPPRVQSRRAPRELVRCYMQKHSGVSVVSFASSLQLGVYLAPRLLTSNPHSRRKRGEQADACFRRR